MAHPANSPHGNDDYTAKMFGPSSPSSEQGKKDDVSWLFGPSPRQKAKRAALSPLVRLALVGALIVGPAVMLTSHHGLSGASAASLPVPQNVAVQYEDDRAAVLTWDAEMRSDRSNPPGVIGYKVTWGPTGGPYTSAETPERIIEAQPLVNGQPYTATIQAIDNGGHLGPASAPIAFTGDSSRVDALRKQMTAFFDDFNLPEGQFDSLKWNVAVSHCAQGMLSGHAINAQFHAHTMISDTNCDRGEAVARPRAVFDITGRTGTVVWDMDGTQRRDQWYLDFSPALTDLDAQVGLEGADEHDNLYPMLRLKQNGNTVSLLYFDANDHENDLASADLEWAGNTYLTYNVRRHFVLHLSKTHLDLSVNGQQVLSYDGLNLPQTRLYPLWDVLSYNTAKGNEPAMLLHWDNFGFDGPAPTTVTHNYQDAGYDGGMDFQAVQGGNATVPITIPDSLAGATAARLMFTLQMQAWDTYAPTANDTVTVNGHTLPVPPVIVPPGINAVDTNRMTTEVIAVDPSYLHTGVNTLTFRAGGTLEFAETHVEVDFPAGRDPAYTQPNYTNPMTMLGAIPPGATVDTINGQWDGIAGTFDQNKDKVFTVSGVTTLGLNATDEIAAAATGKYPGIARVQLLLDGQPIIDQRTDADVPAPSFSLDYPLDTTTLSNGKHTLLWRAYDEAGHLSTPDYFDADTGGQSGDWPITIDVENAGSHVPAASPTATAIPAHPTATATKASAPPSATPRPSATATNTPALPTATSRPSATATNAPVPPSATPRPSATATATQAAATATPQALSVVINGVTANPATATPGSTVKLAGTITSNAALSGAIVDFEVYNASGAKVYQTWQSSVGLSGGTPRTIDAQWTVPSGQAAGVYTLKLGVFSSGWASLYAWANNGATIAIGAASAVAPANTPAPPTATATSIPLPPTAVPANAPSTLGLTTIGAAQDDGDSQYMNGSRVVVGAQGETVNSISAYIGAVDTAPNNQFSFGIYTDDNGKPGTLVAQSATGTLTPNSWNTLPVQATLAANTAYWLEYNTNGTNASVNNMYYDNGPSNTGSYAATPFGTWPSAYGTASMGNWRFSLYANVAP